ncbi:MAG: hypothetical protein ACREP1_12165 [Rhodanobacteraceae bacterium]
MHRYVAFFFGILILAAPEAVALADVSAVSLGLNRCTVAVVKTIDPVNSATAAPGDFFEFKTLDAVTAGSRVVIPARTLGYGTVAVASPAGKAGRAGTLVLEPRYLVLPGGHRLGIVLNHADNQLRKNGNSGDAPGVLGAIPIPGLGVAIGAFNYFHHGKNIVVPKGTEFSVFLSDDPSVQRCEHNVSIVQ